MAHPNPPASYTGKQILTTFDYNDIWNVRRGGRFNSRKITRSLESPHMEGLGQRKQAFSSSVEQGAADSEISWLLRGSPIEGISKAQRILCLNDHNRPLLSDF